MVCYLQVELQFEECIHFFNSPVPLVCNALRLEGEQLRLCVTAYAPQCTHILAQDQGSPLKWINRTKNEYHPSMMNPSVANVKTAFAF